MADFNDTIDSTDVPGRYLNGGAIAGVVISVLISILLLIAILASICRYTSFDLWAHWIQMCISTHTRAPNQSYAKVNVETQDMTSEKEAPHQSDTNENVETHDSTSGIGAPLQFDTNVNVDTQDSTFEIGTHHHSDTSVNVETQDSTSGIGAPYQSVTNVDVETQNSTGTHHHSDTSVNVETQDSTSEIGAPYQSVTNVDVETQGSTGVIRKPKVKVKQRSSDRRQRNRQVVRSKLTTSPSITLNSNVDIHMIAAKEVGVNQQPGNPSCREMITDTGTSTSSSAGIPPQDASADGAVSSLKASKHVDPGISEMELYDLAEKLGNHTNLHKFALKLGFEYERWMRYIATNTRRDGRIGVKGTLDMLIDWQKKTPKVSQKVLLNEALIFAGFAEIVGDQEPSRITDQTGKADKNTDVYMPKQDISPKLDSAKDNKDSGRESQGDRQPSPKTNQTGKTGTNTDANLPQKDIFRKTDSAKDNTKDSGRERQGDRQFSPKPDQTGYRGINPDVDMQKQDILHETDSISQAKEKDNMNSSGREPYAESATSFQRSKSRSFREIRRTYVRERNKGGRQLSRKTDQTGKTGTNTDANLHQKDIFQKTDSAKDNKKDSGIEHHGKAESVKPLQRPKDRSFQEVYASVKEKNKEAAPTPNVSGFMDLPAKQINAGDIQGETYRWWPLFDGLLWSGEEKTPIQVPVVLVTDASGFIAPHIVKKLLEKGCSVRVTLTKKTSPNFMDFLKKAEHSLKLFEDDISEADRLEEVIGGCTYVIHTADSVPDDLMTRSGVTRLLEACVEDGGVKRAIVAGSCDFGKGNFSNYSTKDWPKLDSTLKDAYWKALTEKEALQFGTRSWHAGQKKIEVSIIRSPLVMGPFYFPVDKEKVEMVRRLQDDKRARDIHFPMCDVRDVAQAYTDALHDATAVGLCVSVTHQVLSFKGMRDIIKETFDSNDKLFKMKFPSVGVIENETTKALDKIYKDKKDYFYKEDCPVLVKSPTAMKTTIIDMVESCMKHCLIDWKTSNQDKDD